MFQALSKACFALTLAIANPVFAKGERAGDFDYYVLALSWTPNFCATQNADHPQCDQNRDLGFTLHGLWPQYEKGWPSYCPSAQRPPSRAMTAAEADIYGTSGLAWHQWKKHGSCAGLSAESYFEKARAAYQAVQRPQILREVSKPILLPASVIEEAFLEANPNLTPDQITITCKSDAIQEVRMCLTKELEPRQCGQDVIRDCTLKKARFLPIR